MFKAGHFKQVVPLYEEYLEYFPDEAAEIRLRLAGIMIEKEQRPTAGLRMLKTIPQNTLSESHDEYRIHLIEEATQMINEGIIEFEGGNR
jgi:thioredoxin-like negative regulator of GroEL